MPMFKRYPVDYQDYSHYSARLVRRLEKSINNAASIYSVSVVDTNGSCDQVAPVRRIE